MAVEDEMGVDELRKELRVEWDQRFAFCRALKDLPEIPDYNVQRFIVGLRGVTKFPEDWSRGKTLQQEHRGTVPHKTEYELAVGFWSRLRKGLLENPA